MVSMMVSPGENFQVCFITRVGGWRTSCRGARRPAAVTRLGVLVNVIGGMIGGVGG